MLTKNFEEPILLEPAYIDGKCCNRLRIVTGFTDIERISDHLVQLFDGMEDKKMVNGIRVEMILGMTKGTGLTFEKHKSICKLLIRINSTKGMPKFKCFYIYKGEQVHSKVYVWCKGQKPQIAFCGSANYSMNSFRKRRECMDTCDAKVALKYYKNLLKDTIECTNSSVSGYIKFSQRTAELNDDVAEDNLENLEWSQYVGKTPIAVITVSLLKADGSDTGYGSGVNWGIRKNGTKRNPSQAYIPYNVNDRVEGFFPDKVHKKDKNYPTFKVVTKNSGAFFMRRAQADGKSIQTPESNAILGEMLRHSLGVPDATYITKKMLDDYGRTNVTFKKYENGIYLLEF